MKILNEYVKSSEMGLAYGKCLKEFVSIINEIFGEEIKIAQSKNFTAAKEVIDKMDTIFNVEKKHPNVEFIYSGEDDETAFIIGAQSVEICISNDVKASILFNPFYRRGKPKSDILIVITYNTESEVNTVSDIESAISKSNDCLSKKEKSILNKIMKVITNYNYFIKYISLRV